MNQPPAFDFPTMPARTTIERLDQIPALVAESLLTLGVGAPNPGQRASGHRRYKPGSKPPTELALIDLLRTTDHRDEDKSTAPLLRLAECSRIVWDILNPAERPAQPEALSWAGECGWLAEAWPEAVTRLDAVDLSWVEGEVREIHASLCRMVRLVEHLPMVCTRLGCGEKAHLQPGNRYLVCDGGHTLDIKAEKGRWLAGQDWTLSQTHTALRLYTEHPTPLGTLKTWTARGVLRPIDESRPYRYNFGGVCRYISNRKVKAAS